MEPQRHVGLHASRSWSSTRRARLSGKVSFKSVLRYKRIINIRKFGTNERNEVVELVDPMRWGDAHALAGGNPCTATDRYRHS